MDWLEWLENSEDSSLISSCRLWTRREARCLYSWCIADSSSLIRGTCKNTTHYVISNSSGAWFLGYHTIPKHNAVTVLIAAQTVSFYSSVSFGPVNISTWRKCMHLTMLTAFNRSNSILKVTSVDWMSLHSKTTILECEMLFQVLVFSTKCITYCVTVLTILRPHCFHSLFKQECSCILHFKEKITWLYTVKKQSMTLTSWSQQVSFRCNSY